MEDEDKKSRSSEHVKPVHSEHHLEQNRKPG